MLLGFALMGIASAYGLKSVASDTKTFLLEKELRERGQIDLERDFELICAICRIRRGEYPSLIGSESTEVLPPKGADRAYDFIMEDPMLDMDDFDRFCLIYNRVRGQELVKRQKIWDSEYGVIVSSLKLTDEVITFDKRVNGIQIPHDELIDRLYSGTILGKIALKKGKAVFQDKKSGRLHVWAFRGVKSFEAEKLYKACCRKVGVDLY